MRTAMHCDFVDVVLLRHESCFIIFATITFIIPTERCRGARSRRGGWSSSLSSFSPRHMSKQLALHVPLISRYIKINHIILPLLIRISHPKTFIVHDDNYGFQAIASLVNMNDIRRDERRSYAYNDFRENKTVIDAKSDTITSRASKLTIIIKSRGIQLSLNKTIFLCFCLY